MPNFANRSHCFSSSIIFIPFHFSYVSIFIFIESTTGTIFCMLKFANRSHLLMDFYFRISFPSAGQKRFTFHEIFYSVWYVAADFGRLSRGEFSPVPHRVGWGWMGWESLPGAGSQTPGFIWRPEKSNQEGFLFRLICSSVQFFSQTFYCITLHLGAVQTVSARRSGVLRVKASSTFPLASCCVRAGV